MANRLPALLRRRERKPIQEVTLGKTPDGSQQNWNVWSPDANRSPMISMTFAFQCSSGESSGNCWFDGVRFETELAMSPYLDKVRKKIFKAKKRFWVLRGEVRWFIDGTKSHKKCLGLRNEDAQRVGFDPWERKPFTNTNIKRTIDRVSFEMAWIGWKYRNVKSSEDYRKGTLISALPSVVP